MSETTGLVLVIVLATAGLAALVLAAVYMVRKRWKRGVELVGIAVLMGVWIILVPAFIVPPTYPELQCRAALRGISDAVGLYREREEQMPPNLDALIEDGLMDEDILECPAAESERDSDYFYHPPAEDAPKETLIACDYRNNHDGHRNALDLEGTVHWVTEEAFQQLLDKPENADFARALREFEGQ